MPHLTTIRANDGLDALRPSPAGLKSHPGGARRFTHADDVHARLVWRAHLVGRIEVASVKPAIRETPSSGPCSSRATSPVSRPLIGAVGSGTAPYSEGRGRDRRTTMSALVDDLVARAVGRISVGHRRVATPQCEPCGGIGCEPFERGHGRRCARGEWCVGRFQGFGAVVAAATVGDRTPR